MHDLNGNIIQLSAYKKTIELRICYLWKWIDNNTILIQMNYINIVLYNIRINVNIKNELNYKIYIALRENISFN